MTRANIIENLDFLDNLTAVQTNLMMHTFLSQLHFKRMWANALPNIGGALCSTPPSLLQCRAVMLPRHETR